MGRQILLIDDSAMLRRIAASALGAQGRRYEVVSATRASEGFARACGGETAVILLDERLARSDGTDLCSRLLDEPRTARVPVVLMTGRNAHASDGAALSANVVEILSKPFPPEQLVSVVNTIAGIARKEANFAGIRRALHPEGNPTETGPFTDRLLPDDTIAPSRQTVPDATPAFRSGGTSIRSALQAVTIPGTTGVLRFCPADGIPTEILVDNGRLVLVTTLDGAAYSQGAAEFLPAKVSPATLQDAAAEQGRSGVPFLLELGARGLMSKAGGVRLLQRFGQRHFARLWTVPAKTLQTDFTSLDALPGYALRLEPMRETLDQWLLEGLRLLTTSDIALEARHQGLVGTPSLLRLVEPALKALRLTEGEEAFLRLVDGRRDLPAIARGLGVTPEEVFLTMHRFRCLELLAYRPAPLPFVVTPRTNLRRVLPLKR